MNNKYYCVSGIVKIDGKILFVRHTYGMAKDKILIPGGFVKEGEMPDVAVEREIFEETGVRAKVNSVFSIQFKPSQWCVIFTMDYVSGTPQSDNAENSEVLLLTAEEAVMREDITNLSKEIMKKYIADKNSVLSKSDYVAKNAVEGEYMIFGV